MDEDLRTREEIQAENLRLHEHRVDAERHLVENFATIMARCAERAQYRHRERVSFDVQVLGICECCNRRLAEHFAAQVIRINAGFVAVGRELRTIFSIATTQGE